MCILPKKLWAFGVIHIRAGCNSDIIAGKGYTARNVKEAIKCLTCFTYLKIYPFQ